MTKEQKLMQKFSLILSFLLAVNLFFAWELYGQVQEAWVVRHDGSLNSWDLAEALTLDDEGNIYVTGRSTYTGESYDIVTIKYSSTNGESLWVARYTGSTHQYDGAVDICVDDNSCVYITGYCNTGIFGGDWITIKYNPDGTEAWNQIYSGGSGAAITIDNVGNVIVAGSSGYPYDITTIKYSPDGIQLGIMFYNGTIDGNDYGEDVVIDGYNNIYVTGSIDAGPYNPDIAMIKYDANCIEVWEEIYDAAGYPDTPNGILLGEDENIYVVGSSALTKDTNSDIILIKYNNEGNELWVSRYDYGGSSDFGNFLTGDPNGNIIVAGSSMIPGIPGHYDYTTIKYDSTGSELWAAQYNGPANKWDLLYGGVAVDSKGNSYVCGRSQGVGDDYDYATVKYGPDGTELWVMRYDGLAMGDDYGDGGIAVDANFNVYVTGNSQGINTSADYTTVKYRQNPLIHKMPIQWR